MIFTPSIVPGAWIIDPDRRQDERGFFARSWCSREFAAHGLDTRLVQSNISFNNERGTLRGMHFQDYPYPESKLVRCTKGVVYDVVLDLRPDSPAYCKWQAIELSADNHRALFVPAGCAHGFQSLTDDSEVLYLMTEFFHPALARGVRWNDPVFSIRWPVDNPILSERDASHPDYVA